MTVGRSTRRIGRAANLLLGSAVLALSLAACGVDGSAAPARWPAVSARTTSISVVALMAGATEAPATVPGPCRTGTVKATENSSPGEGICLRARCSPGRAGCRNHAKSEPVVLPVSGDGRRPARNLDRDGAWLPGFALPRRRGRHRAGHVVCGPALFLCKGGSVLTAAIQGDFDRPGQLTTSYGKNFIDIV